jgi:hypothetical protein
MLRKIQDFWSASFHSDRTAFWFDLISFVFTVGASLTLAFTAQNPNMAWIYPGFFVGSVAGVYAYWRRELMWPLLLTAYFACVNVFGFGRAVNWW